MSSLEKVGIATQADIDAVETQEWLEALEAVLEQEGPERAHYLLERLVDLARRSGAHIRGSLSSRSAHMSATIASCRCAMARRFSL